MLELVWLIPALPLLGFLLLLVRISLAVAAGGLVIVAGSLALRIDELRSIVGVMTDLVRRRGRA